MSYSKEYVCYECEKTYRWNNRPLGDIYYFTLSIILFLGLLISCFFNVWFSILILCFAFAVFLFVDIFRTERLHFPFCFSCKQEIYPISAIHYMESGEGKGFSIFIMLIVAGFSGVFFVIGVKNINFWYFLPAFIGIFFIHLFIHFAFKIFCSLFVESKWENFKRKFSPGSIIKGTILDIKLPNAFMEMDKFGVSLFIDGWETLPTKGCLAKAKIIEYVPDIFPTVCVKIIFCD